MNILGWSVSDFEYFCQLNVDNESVIISDNSVVPISYRSTGDDLGCGAFAKVLSVKSSLSLEKYALKVIKDKETLKDEVKIMRYLNQKEILEEREFIVQLIAFFQMGKRCALLMPIYKNLDLFSLMESYEEGLPFEKVIYIAKKIFEILIFLKKHGVIHRDIKLENIFVDDRDEVRLGDFGFAVLKENVTDFELLGTSPYISPELLEGSSLDYPSDMWAVAVLIVTLLGGRYPFEVRSSCELELSYLHSKWVGKEPRLEIQSDFCLQYPNRAFFVFEEFMKTAFLGKFKEGQVEFKELLKGVFELDSKKRSSPEVSLSQLESKVEPAFIRNF